MTSYENGFLRKCAEYGIDGRGLLAKIAQAPEEVGIDPGTLIESSRKLTGDERSALLESLPEERRKYIRKFLYEINGHDPKRYIVKGKDANKNRGEYTYIPDSDTLFETSRQRQINDTNRIARRLALIHAFL